MSSIGARIKDVRKQIHLTQAQFADEIGISQTHVSKIEKDIENPSATLLRLISVKYNINEQWLLDGIGSPNVGWDMRTDEGAIAKYNAMRVQFEEKLRKRTGDDLSNTIEAFAYLDALLAPRKIDDDNTSMYLKYVRLVIDDFEKLTFHASSSLLPSKKDAQGWIRYRNECNEYVRNITENIKNAANLYLVKHGDQMKL